MDKSKIPEKLLDTLTKRLEISDSEKKDFFIKLADLVNTFLNSEATVYCEDCGLVFYYGFAKVVANEEDFVDWKMLSFRHVWDNKHKVKILLPFFSALDIRLTTKDKYLSSIISNIKNQRLGFDEFNQVCYYSEVEKLRSRLVNTDFVSRSNDENWDLGSRCVCSYCHKSYYDPKEACLCHREFKPWLPMSEIESIHVFGGG